MSIDERIPALSDKELATLHSNAERLARTGAPKQQGEAQRLMPLIEAEQAERKARAPAAKAAAPRARAPRKTPTRKVKAS